MYAIKWRDGTPYLVSGKIVTRGTKKKTRWIQWPEKKNLSPLTEGCESIKGAFEKEILDICSYFGRSRFRRFKNTEEPWTLVVCIYKIMRLRRKLEKHGLWP